MTSRVSGLVVAAAFWAVAVSGTKYALAGFGPCVLLSVELVAAAAVLWLVVLVRGSGRRVSWRYAAVLGLLEPCLAYLGETVGLEHTSAANASVLGGLEAVFVVVLAAVVLRERLSAAVCAAVVLGVAGLFVLEQGSFGGTAIGDLLVLGGAFSAAMYTIVVRWVEQPRADGGDPAPVDCLMLTAQQFALAALGSSSCAAVACAGGWEVAPRAVPARLWIAAATVGVIGFAASFLLYNWAIAAVDARAAAVVLNLIPVFGLICAVAWLGEHLSPQRVAGAGLITASVAGFAWVELREVPAPAGALIELDDAPPTVVLIDLDDDLDPSMAEQSRQHLPGHPAQVAELPVT